MNREKMMGDYERTRDVILSCRTPEQLKVGVKMYNQLLRLHNIPDRYIDELEDIIDEMRDRCGVNDMLENMSNIGQEFRKSASSSGIPELQKIMFSEEESLKGGESDKMTIEDIAEKHNTDVEKIKKEVEVGTQIEMEHTKDKKIAKEIAMDHIVEISDYYTDPEYGIMAIEDMKGNKKSIRISKDEMDRLHKTGKINLGGIDITYREDLNEDLDSNEIAQMLRDQLKKKTSKRFSKDEIFDEIRRRRREEEELRKRESDEYRKFIEDNFTDEDETENPVDEASSAGSVGGSYVGAFSTKPITRTFKTDIPVSVNGLNKPIGRLGVLEEEELDESTTVASVGGQYVTPGFPPSKFMGTAGKKGKARVKKQQPSLDNLGYQKVRVKPECSKFPYCNQSPEAIEFYSESRVIKTIKKSDLKFKK